MIELASLVEQCAPHVAADTMLAIIRTESAGNPNAISYEVRRPDGRRVWLQRQPANRGEAIAWATWFNSNGYRFAAGLTQVYSTNFQGYGLTIERAFDPCTNIAAGAAILTDKYAAALDRNGGAKGPALVEALSRYNTGHPNRGIANGYVRQVVRRSPAPRRRRRLAGALLALGLAAGTATAREASPPQFAFDYHVTDTAQTGALRAFDDGARTVIQFLDLDGAALVVQEASTGRRIPVETVGSYAVLDDVYRHVIVTINHGTTEILRKGDMPQRPPVTGPLVGEHMATPPVIVAPPAPSEPRLVASQIERVDAPAPMPRVVTGSITLASEPAPPEPQPDRRVTGTIELVPRTDAIPPERQVRGSIEVTSAAPAPQATSPEDVLATAFAQLAEALGLPRDTAWDRSYVITNGPKLGVFLAASTGTLTVIGVRDLANTPIVFVDADTNKPTPFTAIADFAVIARPVSNLVAAVRGDSATIRRALAAAPETPVFPVTFAQGSAFLQITEPTRLALGGALGKPYSRVLYSASIDPLTTEGAQRMLIVSRMDAIRRYLIRSGVPNDRITEGGWIVPKGQGGEIRVIPTTSN